MGGYKFSHFALEITILFVLVYIMENGLLVFHIEFLPYVLSLDYRNNLSFGNLEYDFDLFFIDGHYFLDIYAVVLDHYGMPMRNTLSFIRQDVSDLFL